MAEKKADTNSQEAAFSVLREEVTDNDCFTGNTHIHTAKILYHVISKQNNGGITIGLEGRWGSGKSTILHLLREGCNFHNTLEENKNSKIHVFLFDAWAHEGDSLRRTFVLEFLRFVGQENLLRGKKFDNLKQEVEHRIKTTKK